MARSRHRLDARAAHHKKNKDHHPLPKALACMVAACFAADAAIANPVGPTVVNGQVSFGANGNQLSIVNTPGSIINWQSFSIGVSEVTRFVQQSASSTVLNRVIGADPSRILGALQSNGRVFLINPNGILFGAGSRIDVAGLVASTLNLSNDDFLNGKLNFTAAAGARGVINQGAITTPSGGEVYLIAPDVQNSGIIQSPQGDVVLAAGHSVELVDADTPNLRVEVDASGARAVNLGQIVADSGKIGIYAGLIKNNGTLQANTVAAGENGEIMLVATQGVTVGADSKITATGQTPGTTGGTVEVTGNSVDLAGGSTIDVSGQSGGGTILVGGGEHGADPALPDAQTTTVESGANLIADAINNGNGGTVIVWSNDTTRFDGHISARGGAQGGNGGFAEVSGEQTLYLTGHADLSAAHGKFGTLLLDPGTVIIEHSGDGGESGPDTLSDAFITNQLNSGDLVISTSDADSFNGVTPQITFNSSDIDIVWSSPTALTLTAGTDINYRGTIAVEQNGAGVNFSAGDSIDINGSITAPVISLVATNGITVEGGAQLSASSNSGNTSTSLQAGSGGIAIFGSVEATGSEDGPGGGSGLVSLTTSGSGEIDVNGGEVIAYGGDGGGSGIGGNATVTMNSGTGGIQIEGGGSVYAGGADGSLQGGGASITLNSSGNFALTGNNSYVQAQGAGGGNATVNVASGGSLLIDGTEGAAIEVYGGDGYSGGMAGGGATITLSSGAGGILLDHDATVYAQGGNGGFTNSGTGGAGGAASITLTSNSGGGITIQNGSYVNAEGGEGGYSNDEGGTGGAGGTASITLNGGSGLIKFDTTGAIEADGGEGGEGDNNGGAGGLATVGLTTTSAIVIQGGGEVYAYGGDGGEGDNNNGGNAGSASIAIGGAATTGITIDNGYVDANGGNGGVGNNIGGAGGSATTNLITTNAIVIQGGGEVYAHGGDGGEGENNNGGNGGSASITLGDGTNTGITINNGYVEASGGEGGESDGFSSAGGVGGAATIALNAGGGGILIENGSGSSSVEADGGEGGYGNSFAIGGNGGGASITLTTPSTIALQTGGGVFASGGYGNDGGEGGGNGGNAAIAFNAGAINISSPNYAEAEGGQGEEGYDVDLSGNGGSASFTLTAAGAISIDSAEVDAFGGEGNNGSGGSGGAANIAFNAGGALSLSNSTVAAYGGEGSLSDATAQIVVAANGPINISDSSVQVQTFEADPTITLTSVTGNINLTDSTITAEGEIGTDFIGMLAGGDIDVLDSSVLSSSGSITVAAKDLNVTANNNLSSIEAGGGTLTAVVLDNINLTGGNNSSTPAFIGGYSGVSLFLGSKTSQIQMTAGTGEDSYAQVVTAIPGTIKVTYLGRTSGGYSVDGQSGVAADAATQTGFYTSPDLEVFTPAIVGNNLFFNYFGGASSSNTENGVPLAVTAALDFIFGEIDNPFQGEVPPGNKKGNAEDNKKNSCS